MKVIQVPKAGADFEMVEREIPHPPPGTSAFACWPAGSATATGSPGTACTPHGTCLACRRGDFVNCPNAMVSGISFDGGYSEYLVAPVAAVASMPESLDPADARFRVGVTV